MKGNWCFSVTLGKLRTNKSLIATFTTSYLLLQFLMSLLFLSHLWYDLFMVRIDNTVLNYDSSLLLFWFVTIRHLFPIERLLPQIYPFFFSLLLYKRMKTIINNATVGILKLSSQVGKDTLFMSATNLMMI